MAVISQADQESRLHKYREHFPLIGLVVVLALLPFVIAIFDGLSVGDVLSNEQGYSKFTQGLLIEIFVLGVYAVSYDLVLGITGLLSFGHAMFFGVGAYLTGVMLKSFGWNLLPTVGMVVLAGVLQALLFGIVLPRVQGITFALVTLGMAAVFHILVQSRELGPYTGADVGLQGVIVPAYLDPAGERLRFYFLSLTFAVGVFLLYKRFVNSPTGRVCSAIRENENRALMMGYNTFYFKLAALAVASITAALAGMLHTLFQPIVSPNVAGLAFTISALLMILIGGVGTLSGAFIGGAIFKILSYGLDKVFGEEANFILGIIYVLIVLFLPFGIVGTWRAKSGSMRKGWSRLAKLFAR